MPACRYVGREIMKWSRRMLDISIQQKPTIKSIEKKKITEWVALQFLFLVKHFREFLN